MRIALQCYDLPGPNGEEFSVDESVELHPSVGEDPVAIVEAYIEHLKQRALTVMTVGAAK